MTEVPDFGDHTKFPESPYYIARFDSSVGWFFTNINNVPPRALNAHNIIYEKTPEIEVLGFSGRAPQLDGLILLNQSGGRDLPTVSVDIFVARPAGSSDTSLLDVRLMRTDGEPLKFARLVPAEAGTKIQSVALLREGRNMQLGGLDTAGNPVPVRCASSDDYLISLGNLTGRRQAEILEAETHPLSA